MGSDGHPAYDRVLERRRAVALARHFCEAEGLSVAQIADRLGRSPATIKAYFYDPTGEQARAVKARYVGVCRGCGAYTQPRNGKGDAYAYCKACHPGAIALERLRSGDWPAASVVTRLFGSWAAARATARRQSHEAPASLSPSATSPLGSNSISLPKPRDQPLNPRIREDAPRLLNHRISTVVRRDPVGEPITAGERSTSKTPR
jgi:hypothetical protein